MAVHLLDCVVSGLQAELERIGNIVCHNCKERMSSGPNLGQHPPVFASQIPAVPTPSSHIGGITTGAPVSFHSSSTDSHNSMSPQAYFPNAQLTNSSLVSPIPTTPSHTLVMPAVPNASTPPDSAESSPIRSVDETAVLWSVIYNTDIEKTLDMTFVHAFHHTSPVCAVRFSPDGRFLAAVLDCDLGRTQIYDMDTRSMKWCAFTQF